MGLIGKEMFSKVSFLSSDWDWDLGLGTWDLGPGTWDLGPRTWDLGPRT